MKYKWLIISILLILVVVLFAWAVQRSQARKQVQASRQSLPNFSFYDLDSLQVSRASLASGKPTLVIYFNSECEHCQYEATELVKNASKLESANIILVSTELIAKIKAFYQKYNLFKIKHLQILKTTSQAFYDYFGETGVPSIFIYNSDNQLIKHFKGEAKIEAILSPLAPGGGTQ
ncbi:MAG: TlpA family protein disulfide reductase [Microscillaceae bacterium]|jgi:thiol-disulfide isomerase/thioredoxin|nr:TlpA family protein disulfide reductase [Microscillaceae bacterium]